MKYKNVIQIKIEFNTLADIQQIKQKLKTIPNITKIKHPSPTNKIQEQVQKQTKIRRQKILENIEPNRAYTTKQLYKKIKNQHYYNLSMRTFHRDLAYLKLTNKITTRIIPQSIKGRVRFIKRT